MSRKFRSTLISLLLISEVKESIVLLRNILLLRIFYLFIEDSRLNLFL